jgi:uncharacterized RDD family membrane protein YckC
MVCILLGAAASASGSSGKLLVAGSDRALWLVQAGADGGRFDVVARPAGGQWQWIARDLVGTPAVAVAGDASLHVVFTSGQYLVFGLEPEKSTPGLSLPAAPLALCLAEGAGLEAAGGLVAIVPLAAAPASAAAESRAPQPSEGGGVEVLTNTNGRWQHLTAFSNVPPDAMNRLRAAACQGAIYLLVPGAANRPNRMAAWQGGKWRDVPLPSGIQHGEAVGLLAMEDRLLMAVAAPAEKEGTVRLVIAARDSQDAAFVVQPVTFDGKEASWASADPPAVSMLSDKLAIVWRTGGAMKLATCSPATGEMDPTEDVKILHQVPSDNRGEQVREFALWVLLLLILVPLFLLRPAGVPKPFALPEPLVPAPLARRLGAAIVDLLPFHLATGIYLRYALPLPPGDEMAMLMDLLRGRGQLPVQVAYALVATIALYLPYCVLMERRYAATLGKMLFKLRVVGDGGAPPQLREVLLRNLIKVLEVFFFAPLLLAVLINRYRQRLGDMVAHTTVIDARSVPTVPPPMPWEDQGNSLGPPPPPSS